MAPETTIEEEEESVVNKLHIAMFPWLAFGHLIPFMELSRRIASKGHKVSFISTPGNLRRLPKVPRHLSSLLHLVPLPLPLVDHLPQTAESTVDLPSDDLRGHLKLAYDGLAALVADFLLSSQPDWLVVDYAAFRAAHAASELGVPCVHLSLFPAAISATWGPLEVLSGSRERTSPEQFTAPPEWIPFPSTIAFKSFEANAIFAPPGHVDFSGVSEGFRYRKTIESSTFVAVRSCEKFEPEWFRLLSKLYEKEIIPVGFFPPMISKVNDDKDDDDDDEWRSLFDWLDKKPSRSVLYAAFGSEVKLTANQVKEIALGLELTGLPFIWAVRSPESWLPEDFLQRIDSSGIVCFNWVPQSRLLRHHSIAGFLTHCGWNSIIEALLHGLPLVMLPMIFDQGLNARYMVETGVGVEVQRNDGGDGGFTADDIAKAARLVVTENDGRRFREAARRSQMVFGDEEMNDGYVENFMEHLLANKRKIC